jgi:hypothetical protein
LFGVKLFEGEQEIGIEAPMLDAFLRGFEFDPVVRRVGFACHPFRQHLAHLHFYVMDQLTQNVRHDRALRFSQNGVGIEEQIAYDLYQTRPALDRLVACKSEQLVKKLFVPVQSLCPQPGALTHVQILPSF